MFSAKIKQCHTDLQALEQAVRTNQIFSRLTLRPFVSLGSAKRERAECKRKTCGILLTKHGLLMLFSFSLTHDYTRTVLRMSLLMVLCCGC